MSLLPILTVLHQSIRIENEKREKERERERDKGYTSVITTPCHFLFSASDLETTIGNHGTEIDRFLLDLTEQKSCLGMEHF